MSQDTPPPRQRAGKRVSLSLDRSGGANPADAPGADINQIVAKYRKHGTLPTVRRGNPLYGDFTLPTDIHSVREAMQAAEDRFGELPAEVRTLAKNDWVTFLELMNEPEGREKLTKAGLTITNTPLNPEPATIPITNSPTPTPAPGPTPTPTPEPEPNPTT